MLQINHKQEYNKSKLKYTPFTEVALLSKVKYLCLYLKKKTITAHRSTVKHKLCFISLYILINVSNKKVLMFGKK